eukprot:767012-Hanusia_phi.AAC.2
MANTCHQPRESSSPDVSGSRNTAKSPFESYRDTLGAARDQLVVSGPLALAESFSIRIPLMLVPDCLQLTWSLTLVYTCESSRTELERHVTTILSCRLPLRCELKNNL